MKELFFILGWIIGIVSVPVIFAIVGILFANDEKD